MLLTIRLEVVAASASLEGVEPLIGAACPRLLVAEPSGLGRDGFAWIGAQAGRWREMKMIVFSRLADEDSTASALAHGAAAYVVKRAQPGAQSLWVTEETIKFHLSNIYRELQSATEPKQAAGPTSTDCSKRDNGVA